MSSVILSLSTNFHNQFRMNINGLYVGLYRLLLCLCQNYQFFLNQRESLSFFFCYQPLVVHCRMGNGRTGMVLALYAMLFEDLDPWQAIKRVRSVR